MRALSQLSAWRRDGFDMEISINVSARNLEETDFAERLTQYALQALVPPELVELEFTESALIRNPQEVISQLRRIRAMGFEIAIDDFGSGYSNFTYLRTIPAGTIKLDQSFIRNMDTDDRDRRLTAAIIAIAHDMGLRVVAEGVETAETLAFLEQCDCDEIQGYYASRPLESGAVPDWLDAWKIDPYRLKARFPERISGEFAESPHHSVGARWHG